jgi:2-dehydro-3-deoxyglucarate aldolase/4-hydroxy-2-oxoheptanedioate aldolase
MTYDGGLRGRLRAPGPVYLAQMLMPEPAVATILGNAGFDFVMVDVEHGPFTLTSLRACVEAFHGTGTPVVVRTASCGEVEIKQVLDLGVDGVMGPRVESAAEAETLVRAARYPPEGRRGVSRATRAARYGVDGVSYVETANARIAVVAIIESGAGVANVEEIVAVPGLDGIMVGGDDLSADLGLFGRSDDVRLRDAVATVVRATLAAGLRIGAGYEAQSERERDQLLVHCFLDAIGLDQAARAALEHRRSSFGGGA